MLDDIRIVMVEITHPGNIGAAARAMKAMGYETLYLVKPKIYPSAEATARAAGADDILAKAVVCDSLDDALQGCVAVVATTARSRTIWQPTFTPSEYAPQLSRMVKSGPVALLFGRESSGLSNDELEYCNAILSIPTNPDFSSLNVASAVQIVCYEFAQDLRLKVLAEHNDRERCRLATTVEMAHFYEHLQNSMADVGFLNAEKPRKLMRRLKAMFNRAHLDENELSILRGFLAALQKVIK